MDIQQLIQGCLQNDRRAQRSLYLTFAPALLSICRRYASCTPQAEDMLQQSFIRIFNSLAQFRFQGSFEGWLRRITVHVCLRCLQQQMPAGMVASTDDMPEIAADAEILEAIDGKRVLALIQQLPHGYRMVLNLFVFEGHSHDEIARLLGITEGTSRSQLAKARRSLKKLLEEHEKVIVYE